MERTLAGSEDVRLVKAFGPDLVYALRPRAFDPATMAVRLYAPARAAVGQPYTAYLIALNRGQDSYGVAPTDLVRVTADWEGASLGAESAEARLPLVVSPGGAAVVPLPLAAPGEAGSYRLSVSAGEGPLGAWAAQGAVEVGAEGDPSFPVPARLADWSVASQVKAGQALDVNLEWLALDYIESSYSVYVKLLRDGQQVAGWDGPPQGGQAPTNSWQPGQVIDDVVTLEVPPDAPAGAYTVEVGMYRYTDLARALTLNDEGMPVERIVLGTVQVQN
jgi:hypothetical protein